jgi:low molecular weight protein-tyrosine phosphatase
MSPFSVLHVCMGNICRSPMAERLLHLAVRERVGDQADKLVLSASAGTGGWHAGDAMNPPAARELRRRGGDDAGFRARQLLAEHVDAADLVLTATAEQVDYVVELRPDAAARTFVIGQFGRLLAKIDLAALPPAAPSPSGVPEPDAVYARGVELVAAVDAARAGRQPQPEDELDDPWGRPDRYFTRAADEIHDVVRPLVAALLG